MAADIIKPAYRTFWDVLEHIQHSDWYWSHFKVLCEFGILTWFYSNYIYGHTTYFIAHDIFVTMVRVALVRLMGSTSSWSYQLMSNTRTMAGSISQQQIACAHMTLTWNSHSHGEIIVYSRSTINAYSLLSHEWCVPLIKFMVGPTIYVRGGSTHLWYSGST